MRRGVRRFPTKCKQIVRSRAMGTPAWCNSQVISSGSPVWTRFELLRANWHCDRTDGRILFSSSLTRRGELYPCRAPSLDTSRTRQGIQDKFRMRGYRTNRQRRSHRLTSTGWRQPTHVECPGRSSDCPHHNSNSKPFRRTFLTF
jgi:hypothetical protein